jgi:DDE superfamily endonuclease
MNILNQVLTNLPIRKTQATFLNLLCALILAIPGRINYANLERFSHQTEKTFRNWAEKPIEWVHIAVGVAQALQTNKRIGSRFILGIDCTALRKAGKHTPGIAKFWDSKLGKAVPSLELSCCTLIDLECRQPIPVHARQTPSALPDGESRVDHYRGHVQDVLGTLPASVRTQVECVVGDAYYSKKSFVDGVTNAGKAFVGKLRVDANLKYKYIGSRTGKPGRPKKFDGKVDWKEFSKWDLISSGDPSDPGPIARTARKVLSCEQEGAAVESKSDEQIVYSSVLYAPALKRFVRVVCILWHFKGQTRREVLFSTNLEMPALEVVECYRARFEMEFPFRDAKQFAGLMDSQSRSEQALEFAWNASFLTVSLARAQQLLAFEGDVRDFVFSMEDSKRRAYNELFADRIIRLLPVGLSFDKCLALVENALNLGVKAA